MSWKGKVSNNLSYEKVLKEIFQVNIEQTFTYAKLTIETLEKGVKYA